MRKKKKDKPLGCTHAEWRALKNAASGKSEAERMRISAPLRQQDPAERAAQRAARAELRRDRQTFTLYVGRDPPKKAGPFVRVSGESRDYLMQGIPVVPEPGPPPPRSYKRKVPGGDDLQLREGASAPALADGAGDHCGPPSQFTPPSRSGSAGGAPGAAAGDTPGAAPGRPAMLQRFNG